ncbi:MAG: hypothetical protein IJ702_08305 [Fretibacterium sp.]|nr:hypothetical protein [Fretibacterium sp.]
MVKDERNVYTGHGSRVTGHGERCNGAAIHRFIAALALSLLLCGAAGADVLYVVEDSDGKEATGRISYEEDGSLSADIASSGSSASSPLSGALAVYPFTSGGTDYILTQEEDKARPEAYTFFLYNALTLTRVDAKERVLNPNYVSNLLVADSGMYTLSDTTHIYGQDISLVKMNPITWETVQTLPLEANNNSPYYPLLATSKYLYVEEEYPDEEGTTGIGGNILVYRDLNSLESKDTIVPPVTAGEGKQYHITLRDVASVADGRVAVVFEGHEYESNVEEYEKLDSSLFLFNENDGTLRKIVEAKDINNQRIGSFYYFNWLTPDGKNGLYFFATDTSAFTLTSATTGKGNATLYHWDGTNTTKVEDFPLYDLTDGAGTWTWLDPVWDENGQTLVVMQSSSRVKGVDASGTPEFDFTYEAPGDDSVEGGDPTGDEGEETSGDDSGDEPSEESGTTPSVADKSAMPEKVRTAAQAMSDTSKASAYTLSGSAVKTLDSLKESALGGRLKVKETPDTTRIGSSPTTSLAVAGDSGSDKKDTGTGTNSGGGGGCNAGLGMLTLAALLGAAARRRSR